SERGTQPIERDVETMFKVYSDGGGPAEAGHYRQTAAALSIVTARLKPSRYMLCGFCELCVDRRGDYALPIARFSNRVNSRMKASFTTPVGPLRCLPTISSATPCASVAGWLLSAY